MTIQIRRGNRNWTKFEQREWAKVNQLHYGLQPNWDEQHLVIFAKEGRETIGALRLKIQAGVGYIEAVIVKEALRGTGIGTTLVQRAEQLAREHGAHKLHLLTGQEWGEAAFYEQLGFHQSAVVPAHYLKVDFVEMMKLI